MAPRKKTFKAPLGYSWMAFLKTYRQKNNENYARTRHGNTRLMRAAGKAWALFKEQAAASFTELSYGNEEIEDQEMEAMEQDQEMYQEQEEDHDLKKKSKKIPKKK